MEDLRWRTGFQETSCLSCPHSLQPQHDVMGLREPRGAGWTAVTRSIKGHWPCQIGPSQNLGSQGLCTKSRSSKDPTLAPSCCSPAHRVWSTAKRTELPGAHPCSKGYPGPRIRAQWLCVHLHQACPPRSRRCQCQCISVAKEQCEGGGMSLDMRPGATCMHRRPLRCRREPIQEEAGLCSK